MAITYQEYLLYKERIKSLGARKHKKEHGKLLHRIKAYEETPEDRIKRLERRQRLRKLTRENEIASRRKHREENRELYRRQDREAYARNKEKILASRKTTEKRVRYNSRAKLNHAIRNGKIKRLPCQIKTCGKKAEAHHNSYEKAQALNVNWFCPVHHRAWHRVFIPEYGEENRQTL
jgi:hypothetical protein